VKPCKNPGYTYISGMIKADLPKYIKLCRMGNGYYFNVPIDYVRAHKYDTGNGVEFLWKPELNGTGAVQLLPPPASPQMSAMPSPPDHEASHAR
jgi:hypothetical protein